MRTLSKKISPWLRARWPILLSGGPFVTPGRLSGTSATPPPAIPFARSTPRNASACVAMVPFDTHADFWPLST